MRANPFVLSFSIGALCLLVGCQEDFRPQSDLEGLEVLGIQASPPAIVLGETSVLTCLGVQRRGSTDLHVVRVSVRHGCIQWI